MIKEVVYKLQGNNVDSWVITYEDDERVKDIIFDFPPLIEKLYLEDFVDILTIESFKTQQEHTDFLVRNKRDIKLDKLENNYVSACKYFIYLGFSYSIEPINLIDLNGLITLGQSSNIGVINSDGQFELKMHSLEELVLLFDSIRIYLTTVKTTRFLKRSQLTSLSNIDEINNFDISI